jgi:hypothetical protein
MFGFTSFTVQMANQSHNVSSCNRLLPFDFILFPQLVLTRYPSNGINIQKETELSTHPGKEHWPSSKQRIFLEVRFILKQAVGVYPTCGIRYMVAAMKTFHASKTVHPEGEVLRLSSVFLPVDT